MTVIEHLLWYTILIIVVYFGYNLGVIGAMLKDAKETSFRESGCTPLHIVLAFFLAAPLHTITIFVCWVLPVWHPVKYRVGGEKVRD